jgi:hypothetical protein
MTTAATTTPCFDKALLGLCYSYVEQGDSVLPVIGDRLEETGDPRLADFRLLMGGWKGGLNWRDPEVASQVSRLNDILPEIREAIRRARDAEDLKEFTARSKPKVGSYVEPDGWGYGGALLPSDWDAAAFRLPTPRLEPVIKDVAVNITVTGRKVRRRCGSDVVRVRIEYVGDCEPSTHHAGWMVV